MYITLQSSFPNLEAYRSSVNWLIYFRKDISFAASQWCQYHTRVWWGQLLRKQRVHCTKMCMSFGRTILLLLEKLQV